MTSTLLATDGLNACDRCDRCGAQAFFRAILHAGELLFCAHHGRAHAERLAQVAVEVQDGTAAINARPSPAAY